jgi:hypothetical protein
MCIFRTGAACLLMVLGTAAASWAGDVTVSDVNNYVYGNYQGSYSPNPPHADGNPKHAVVVSWSDANFRLVFDHEASYCPFFELPSGGGCSYQFWEGNDGVAELMNQYGRMEQNSSVQVLSQGPNGAHIQWTYYGVNVSTGQRYYQGVEDFYAMPNGLVLRRQAYTSLQPSSHYGYSREPIELIGMAPRNQTWADVLQTDPNTGARHALAVLDPFSTNQYNVYWTPTAGTVWDSAHSRDGTAATWAALNNSAGTAIALPMKGGSAFTIFGDASGFAHDLTNLKEHTYGDSAPAEVWGSCSWDHWPIGWVNSQGHVVDSSTLPLYPNAYSPMGMDLFAMSDQQAQQGVYYSIIGVGSEDNEAIRTLANEWLTMGSSQIFDPASIAQLPAIYTPAPEPSTLVLLALAGLGIAWFRRRKKSGDNRLRA